MLEKRILRLLWLIGVALLPTLFKKPLKDRWITFLLNGLLNVYLDNYLVSTKRIKYPIRLKYASFLSKGSVLYDSILCPLVTTWYYESTLKSKKIRDFLYKTFLFVTPQIVTEIILEKKTRIITYKNGWKWYHSFGAVVLIKVFVVGFVRLLNNLGSKEA